MHTLILIHGMGEHAEGAWHQPIVTQLAEISKRYKWFKGKKLDDYVKVVPVGYDKFIRAALARWEESRKALSGFFAESKLFEDTELPDLSALDGDVGKFTMSHLADVLIYRLLALEHANIVDQVAFGIATAVTDTLKDDPSNEVSVMAHSLGTSVAHDALAKLFQVPDIKGVPSPFAAGVFRLRSIHMVCNVSRLLQTKPKAYESKVRPGRTGSVNSCCERMYGYRHELDPIARPKSFEPVGWSRYAQVDLRHVADWDVHAWSHYLDNPRVHIPLLNTLMPRAVIRKKEMGEAEAAYPGFIEQALELADPMAFQAKLGAAVLGIPVEAGLDSALGSLVSAFQVMASEGGQA